jgi:hypothetical protein
VQEHNNNAHIDNGDGLGSNKENDVPLTWEHTESWNFMSTPAKPRDLPSHPLDASLGSSSMSMASTHVGHSLLDDHLPWFSPAVLGSPLHMAPSSLFSPALGGPFTPIKLNPSMFESLAWSPPQ